MKTEKLGQESAFPSDPLNVVVGRVSFTYKDEYGVEQIGYRNEYAPQHQHGMSKRFYAACAAMQGILANEAIMNVIGESNEHPQPLAVRMAYSFADELLKQESE